MRVEVLHGVPRDVERVSIPAHLRPAEIGPVVRIAVLNVRQ